MNIRLFFALTVAKVISFLTKLLRFGGGSAAPGYYALKIYPDLISDVISKIPQNIIITGTNGKTTTARMLAHFAKEAGLKIIRNHTGSNLERGIASSLISNIGLLDFSLNFDLGIWELDESAFNSVGLKLKPDVVVFLNIFRDQLDRYGEVDSTIKKWQGTVSKLNKKTKIILNGDDQNLLELKKLASKGQAQTFGVENFKISGEKKLLNLLEKLDFEAKNIEEKGLSGTNFILETFKDKWRVSLAIPGIYHIYDFLAAFSVAEYLELKPETIINSFKNFSPAFGRVEKLSLPEGKTGYIFLIKNPAGANQVFQTIKKELTEKDRLFIALNDNFADGTDVSWIWDANFETLRNSSRAESRDFNIICSGTRSYDLALRLKYAGFDEKYIVIEPSLRKAFNQASGTLEGRLFIFPTYTAMLELQSILAKTGIKKHYWEEK